MPLFVRLKMLPKKEEERGNLDSMLVGNSEATIELEAKLKADEHRIRELEEDREQWRQQATRLLSQADDRTPKGFWRRVFG
jgi:hypothetical protein